MSTSAQTHPWFAIRVKPRHEYAVAAALRFKDFEVFLPTYQAHHKWSDRVKRVECPLFPGYLFCRLNLRNRLPVLTLPGVIRIVGAGGVFIPVEEHEIAALQDVVQRGSDIKPEPYLKVGQKVWIEEGPLRGVEGILISTPDGQRRVLISIDLLQRSVSTQVDEAVLRPLEQKNRSSSYGKVLI